MVRCFSFFCLAISLLFSGHSYAFENEVTLEIGSEEREYLLYIPDQYKDIPHMPLYIVFHGGLGSSKNMRGRTKFDAWADKMGFIVAYPQGKKRTWNAGDCCFNLAGREGLTPPDDIAFTKAIIYDLAAKFSIDTRKVYAIGHSNGAMMAHRIGCEMSDMVSAIVAVSGTIKIKECVPLNPVDVLIIHATDDVNVPYEGGEPLKGIRKLYGKSNDMSVADAFYIWQRNNECGEVISTPDGEHRYIHECVGSARVRHLELTKGGHKLFEKPKRFTPILKGRDRDDDVVNMTDDIMYFLNDKH